MKSFDKKIKIGLAVCLSLLIVIVAFAKSGILFSNDESDVVMVSTSKKSFDPNHYVASVAAVYTTTTTTTTTTTKTTTTTVATTVEQKSSWDGPVLTRSAGVVYGPSGKETYYNLDMSGIVRSMRNAGYSEEEYPYWVRDDGVKMLGKYVMVAAAYSIRPRGTIVESSLGTAIVCDTGGFAYSNPTQLDIAVTW